MNIHAYNVTIPKRDIDAIESARRLRKDHIGFNLKKDLEFSTRGLESYTFSRWAPVLYDAKDLTTHGVIVGMTGSGKSYFSNFLLQNAQKYAPLTFIFDIGGSFQSLTTIFGGSYLNVGQEARDFTINPFSLPQTKENLQFLFSFFRVLIEGNEQRYRLDFKEERRLWDAIERLYVLEPNQRTLSNFTNIVGELKERLHRWTRGGQYGFLFDNAEDTLSFCHFQAFNFHGWNDAPEVLERQLPALHAGMQPRLGRLWPVRLGPRLPQCSTSLRPGIRRLRRMPRQYGLSRTRLHGLELRRMAPL